MAKNCDCFSHLNIFNQFCEQGNNMKPHIKHGASMAGPKLWSKSSACSCSSSSCCQWHLPLQARPRDPLDRTWHQARGAQVGAAKVGAGGQHGGQPCLCLFVDIVSRLFFFSTCFVMFCWDNSLACVPISSPVSGHSFLSNQSPVFSKVMDIVVYTC